MEQEPNRARLLAMHELSNLLEARSGKIDDTTAVSNFSLRCNFCVLRYFGSPTVSFVIT